MRSAVAGHWKLTTTNWEQSSKLLQLREKLLKNPISTVLQSFCIWSKLERWKSLISGCLMNWLKIKEIIVLKCRLLLFCATMHHFSIGLWLVTKSGFYTTMSSVVELRRSCKAFPKAKLAPQKGPWLLFGGLLPSDPLQLSESWWNRYIWKVCSAIWWDAPKTAMLTDGIS